MNIDDPKLTAYALGELRTGERREIERELARSAELRAAVEEIRAAATMLRQEFACETSVRTTFDTRERTTRTVSSGSSYSSAGAFAFFAFFWMSSHARTRRSRSAANASSGAPSAAVRTMTP